jgi:type VI secretion system protein ImpF
VANQTLPAFRPSLLDRLTDQAPRSLTDPPQSDSQLLTEIHESVRRDLEDLLNSRCVSPPAEFSELRDSLVNFGLADLTKAGGPRDVGQLCEHVKSVIERFEPRLREVTVQAPSHAEVVERQLKLRITATLQIEPWSAPIAFDSVLDSSTGGFGVTRGRQ